MILKIHRKNIQCDSYQGNFKEFETALQENFGLKSFDTAGGQMEQASKTNINLIKFRILGAYKPYHTQ